jgi:cation diffusion facilitator CzcD-associated flavoprotein CzcO
MAPTDIDIAIVGAGVFGAYAAWRLSTHFGRAKLVELVKGFPQA